MTQKTQTEFSPTLDRRIAELLRAPGYRPLRRSEIARVLGLRADQRRALRVCLKAMEDRGEVTRQRRNRYAKPGASEVATGILRLHPRGFGFVTEDGGARRQIHVPSSALGPAIHDDRVRIAVQTAPPLRGGPRRHRGAAPESAWRGRVMDVIEHTEPLVVGLLQVTPYYAYMVPDDPRHAQNIRIRAPAPGAPPLPKAGRKVVVKLDAETGPAGPRGRVVEDLGDAEDPAVAIPGLMRRYGITPDFEPSIRRLARSRGTTPDETDLRGRRDLREACTFTIDPEDAKDFDDAVSIEPLAGGGWKLGVHIADVAHVVEQDRDIDREARRRGTSVYLVDRSVPMLPPYLTTDVCSLKPELDRLTHTVEIRIGEDGTTGAAETFRSVIRSGARLDYAQVQRFFDQGEAEGVNSDVGTALGILRRLAHTLRQRRMAQGALDIHTPEVRCRMDRQGRVQDITLRREIEAYQVIEECMLLANQAVARRIGEAGSPCLYRIHDEPDDAQWAQMGDELAALGFTLSERSHAGLRRLLKRASGTPLQAPATMAVLRNLKRAVYEPHHRPHFGLAMADYAHFTSPIRRYPDLVVHRLLNAVEAGAPPPYADADLKDIGAHCSKREREADEAERESLDIKRTEYYARRLDEGITGPWRAMIVSILPKGLIVELSDTLQRGLVPFSALRGGHWQASADRTRARRRGRHGTWRLGQSLLVQLSRVDLRRRFVDFRAEPDAQPPESDSE